MPTHHWITCCACNTQFAMADNVYRTAKERAEHGKFWCPNGHIQYFPRGKSELEKARAEVEDMRRRAERAEQGKAMWQEEAEIAKRSASAYKGAATRLKNRAKAGVCPCCNRTFQDLARHMATKHPDAELDNVVEFGQAKA